MVGRMPLCTACGDARAEAIAAAPIQLLRYASVDTVCTSDHKPVVAEFSVSYEGEADEQVKSLRRGGVHGEARSGSGHATRSAMCNLM